MPSQVTVHRQLLEWKHALTGQQVRQRTSQQHVEIEIEATETEHCEVAKEINFLNRLAKGLEGLPVFRELRFYKTADVLISEEDILPIWVQQLEIAGRDLSQRRKATGPVGLDNPTWYRHLELKVDERR